MRYSCSLDTVKHLMNQLSEGALGCPSAQTLTRVLVEGMVIYRA